MTRAIDIIREVAEEYWLFRERDVRAKGVSPSLLDDARAFGYVKPHGHGVWGHAYCVPTRYELLQIRAQRAVFWGPSALWLQGAEKEEPEEMWIAVDNSARLPQNLELGTVVIRTRNLERDVVTLDDDYRAKILRVHSVERARADIAKNDCAGLLMRAFERRELELAPFGDLLTASTQAIGRWKLPPPPPPGYNSLEREDWKVVRSLPQSLSNVLDRARRSAANFGSSASF